MGLIQDVSSSLRFFQNGLLVTAYSYEDNKVNAPALSSDVSILPAAARGSQRLVDKWISHVRTANAGGRLDDGAFAENLKKESEYESDKATLNIAAGEFQMDATFDVATGQITYKMRPAFSISWATFVDYEDAHRKFLRLIALRYQA